MRKLLVTIGLLTLFVSAAFAGGDGEEGSGGALPDITLEGYSRETDERMGFDLQWKVDGQTLHVQMAALTTGWIAVGFDPTNMMANANFLIGYVSNGTPFMSDHFGDGTFKHTQDTKLGGKDNFSDVEGEEINGATLIRFSIPLDSGDAYDKPLEQGKTYRVIYAYGPNGKDDFATYHSKNRGGFEITL